MVGDVVVVVVVVVVAAVVVVVAAAAVGRTVDGVVACGAVGTLGVGG